jgi:preprotein translocase subunit YajC
MTKRYFYLFYFFVLVVLPNLVTAQQQVSATSNKPSISGMFLQMMPMFLIVFMIFHFLVLRPQKKQLEEHTKLLQSLKKGAQIVTSSGIFGRVVVIDDDSVTVELEQNARMKIEKNHIVKIS